MSNRSFRGNLTNRLKDMKERISGLKDKVEETDRSVKENVITEKRKSRYKTSRKSRTLQKTKSVNTWDRGS